MSNFILPESAFRRPVLAVGTTGAGKSYNQCGARVIPALQRQEQVVIIDPTDAWFGINFMPDGKRPSNFDVPIFGGEHGHMQLTPNMGAAIGELLGRQKLNAILSLKHMDDIEQVRFVGDLSRALLVHNRKPIHYVIDEADEFCPQLVDRSSREVQLCKRQIKRIVTRGRKSGFRPVLITQRPQALDTAVRNQCQVLVALQLMGSHERKMLDDYVKSNGDPAQVKDMLATLAQLAVGEAWVWVPRERYLERVRFPRLPVFDSFNDDESAYDPKGISFASVDLSKIEEALGDYLEEQKRNDPVELRRRIHELELELEAATPDPVDTSELEHNAWKKGFDDAHANHEEDRIARINALERVLALAGTLRDELSALSTMPQFAKPIDGFRPMEKKENRFYREPPAAAVKPKTAVERPPAKQIAPNGPGKAGKAILDALALWSRWGFAAATMPQLALLAGYHPRTKGFLNALSALSSAGLVVRGSGTVEITAAGDSHTSVRDRPKTEIYGAVQKQAGKAAREIMDALRTKGTLTWDEIAQEIGVHPRTKGALNARSWLNALTVITKRGEKYRLSGWILGARDMESGK